MTSAVDRRRHWDRVFEERGPSGVSWHERSPRMSLEMIGLTDVGPDEAVLDVGGGTSPLAGALLARGFADLTVLDLSEVALQASRSLLGPVGARARWVHADVLDWIPTGPTGSGTTEPSSISWSMPRTGSATSRPHARPCAPAGTP